MKSHLWAFSPLSALRKTPFRRRLLIGHHLDTSPQRRLVVPFLGAGPCAEQGRRPFLFFLMAIFFLAIFITWGIAPVYQYQDANRWFGGRVVLCADVIFQGGVILPEGVLWSGG